MAHLKQLSIKYQCIGNVKKLIYINYKSLPFFPQLPHQFHRDETQVQIIKARKSGRQAEAGGRTRPPCQVCLSYYYMNMQMC